MSQNNYFSFNFLENIYIYIYFLENQISTKCFSEWCL